MKLVLTCEHAGNKVPQPFRKNFLGKEKILASHRGYDHGAYGFFKTLQPLALVSFSNEWSRLVVEVNRSIGHQQLFSEFTKSLPKATKKDLLQHYYFNYRNKVENEIAKLTSSDEEILHLSVHSFTPEFSGEIRNTDIGLLYDPARKSEKQFCRDLKENLQKILPEIKVRFNYPYLGKADGFTTYLRKKFPEHYLGIEIELNQALLIKDEFPKNIEQGIFDCLQKMLA